MSRLATVDSSPAASPASKPTRSLLQKVAWVQRHSAIHAHALEILVDQAITAINAAARREVKRLSRRP